MVFRESNGIHCLIDHNDTENRLHFLTEEGNKEKTTFQTKVENNKPFN